MTPEEILRQERDAYIAFHLSRPLPKRPLPPLDTQCTAGPGMRCQCASCRAMRKQLWAVQPEEQA